MNVKSANKRVIIRPYRPEDLESGRALWVELTAWHRYIYDSPGIGGADPGHHFDEHLSRVGPERIWVAEVDGRVVGLTGLILEAGEAELEPMVVSEAYRHMGIGQQLAETVISAAQEEGISELKVRPVARNETAIQFFHEMGFDILGHIELFMDFHPAEQQVWKRGERLAGKNFRI